MAPNRVTVHVAPNSFELGPLFEAAWALDTDDFDEDARGVKRRAESDAEGPLCAISSGDESASGPTPDAEQGISGSARTQGETDASERNSRRKRDHNRRATKRRMKTEKEGRQVREEVGQAYVPTEALLSLDVRYVDLPVSSCGFHGKIESKSLNRSLDSQTVEALKEGGCNELVWNGINPEAVVDRKSGTVLLVLAGRPNDKQYDASVERVKDKILEVGGRAGFSAEERNHRRADDSPALNIGNYYGGGGQKPGNLDNGRHSKIAQELIRDPDLSRVAGFADAAFKMWLPKVYENVDEALKKLYKHDSSLVKNWKANVYPCAAVNFGPRVCCKVHKDFGNAPQTFCAIQAFGSFDATKGGHLYIQELNLLIQFPSGSTILIPSALFSHGNTPVAAHETRVSFTQFVPGGLLRYVHNGFQTENKLKKRSKKLYREKMEEKLKRWETEMGRISTLSELETLYWSPKAGGDT